MFFTPSTTHLASSKISVTSVNAYGQTTHTKCKLVSPRPIYGALREAPRILSEIVNGMTSKNVVIPFHQRQESVFPSPPPPAVFNPPEHHSSCHRATSPTTAPSPFQLPDPLLFLPQHSKCAKTTGSSNQVTAHRSPSAVMTHQPPSSKICEDAPVSAYKDERSRIGLSRSLRWFVSALPESERSKMMSDEKFEALKRNIAEKHRVASPVHEATDFVFKLREREMGMRSSIDSNSTLSGSSLPGFARPREVDPPFASDNNEPLTDTTANSNLEPIDLVPAHAPTASVINGAMANAETSDAGQEGRVLQTSFVAADVSAPAYASAADGSSSSRGSSVCPSSSPSISEYLGDDEADIPATRWHVGDGCPIEFLLTGGRSVSSGSTRSSSYGDESSDDTSSETQLDVNENGYHGCNDAWISALLSYDSKGWPYTRWVANSAQGDLISWLAKRI